MKLKQTKKMEPESDKADKTYSQAERQLEASTWPAIERALSSISYKLVMPLRRYLRISKGAALEMRIYVTGHEKDWFTETMLTDLLQLIKPLILPKLREERAAIKKKKGPTKDTIENGKTSDHGCLTTNRQMHSRQAFGWWILIRRTSS
jgi:hypothetical protein